MGGQQHERPVLIAGGGIAGCATALALAQRGFEVTVLEQASEFKDIGAGIQLGPNAFRVLDLLGLRRGVEECWVRPDHLVMMDALSDELVTRVSVGAPFRSRFGQPYALIYRPDLHRILANACRTYRAIRMLCGQKVVGFDELGREILVRTEAGLTHRGSALVGADGLWSKVREVVVRDGQPTPSGHIAYRAVLPAAEVPADLRTHDMTLWAGPKFHLVHYPLRGGELFNLVAVFHSDRHTEGWNTAGDPEELHTRFREACPRVRTLLSRIDTWRMWVLADREPVDTWSRGRATLVGDAAHPMLQYLAQGACMAMEDAVVLSACLHKHRGEPAVAFDLYQTRRYLRACRAQVTARIYGQVYHAAGPIRDLRNRLLRERSDKDAIESLAWLYDPIPLSASADFGDNR